MKTRIYLDHAATTPLRKEVWEAMQPYYTQYYGNASSLHEEGQMAKKGLESSRRQIASLLGVKSGEILFTSGGSESDNWALRIALMQGRKYGKNHVITTEIEHSAMLASCRFLESMGVCVTYLPVDREGYVDPETVANAITKETCLVSVMTANNEIGTIQKMNEIGEICHKQGILFHTDAVQAFGKIPIHIQEWHIDMMSVSAHKFYGPKGCGFLYIRGGVEKVPMIYGGAQERGYRAGTENVAQIAGMAKAAEYMWREMESESRRLYAWQERMTERILEKIPGTHINSPLQGGVPGLINVRFDQVEGESLAVLMDMNGVSVSTASACESGAVEPSHVLTAISLSKKEARNAIRITPGLENSEDEIETVVNVIAEAVEKIRHLANGW